MAEPTRLDSKNESRFFDVFVKTKMAEPTRLELATSAVTGQRSNQLSYDSTSHIIYHLWPKRNTSCLISCSVL